MNNLTTRKIVLGMLMALVLTFSVQGIVDALTFSTSRSGDLATELRAPNDFDIRFSVSLKGNTSIKNSDGDLVDENGNLINSSGYYINADGDYVTSAGGGTVATTTAERVKAENDVRYHYSQEQVTIAVPNAEIIEVGRYDIDDTDSHVLMETGEDGDKLSSSITLTLEAATANVVTITISDTTPTTDLPNGVTDRAPAITFTVYVVPGVDTDTPTVTGGGADGVEIGNDFGPVEDIDDLFAVDPNLPLTYEVEGSGRVFVQVGNRKTSATSKLETSSSAPVYLDMKGSSNKVTVWVRGTDAKRNSASITFINTYADPQITDGDNQRGATRGRLAEPLEVTVKDASGKVIPGGVVVGFDSEATDSMFAPVPGTTVYVNTITDTLVSPATDSAPNPSAPTTVATSTSPPAIEGPIYVKTDSSGKAQVYSQLGSTEGPQRVTISVGRTAYTDTFFRQTAADVETTDASTITIEDGDGQRADVDEPLEEPLVVIVKDSGGRIVEGAAVTFTTNGGELSPPESRDPGDYTTADSHNDRFLVVNTDETGRASVRYNVGDLAGAKQIFATIIISNGRTREKTFNVNGRASTTRRPADDDDDDADDDTGSSVTASVPSSVTGTAGGTTVLTFTTNANAASVFVGSPTVDTFPTENISTPTQSGTTHTRTLTLPSQIRTYTLGVYINNTRYPVTVSVTAAAQTDGTLTVRIDPNSGAPGSTATVTVTATNADGTVAPNVPVTLRITPPGGGSFSPSAVTTGAAGTATSTLTRGSTVGSNYFVTASSTSGYTQLSALSSGERVLISTGTSPGASSERAVGEAADVDVYDGNNQDGLLNSRLADPLVVEVVDANDNPVEDVQVRFQVTQGSGRFSPSRPRTDRNGRAQTRFIPASTGRIRISVSVDGVTARAVFIVQGGEPADALVKISGDDQSGTPGNALASPFVVEAQDEDGEPLAGHSVTFAVTAGGGSLSETSARTNANGRAQTTLTLGSAPGVNSVQASVTGVDSVTFSTSIEAKILVAAANRPVMYWIAGGGLYSLSGAKEAKIAESANGVAVGGGKIYWTSQDQRVRVVRRELTVRTLTAQMRQTLTSIFGTFRWGSPLIPPRSKLYWTNTRGRIQSANLNGSGIQNVLLDLSDPTDIVVSNGFIYWTEGGNSVRRVNISGQSKITRDVAT